MSKEGEHDKTSTDCHFSKEDPANLEILNSLPDIPAAGVNELNSLLKSKPNGRTNLRRLKLYLVFVYPY
jgi:hypothetical protein